MISQLKKIVQEAGFTVLGSFGKSGIGFLMTAIIARFVSSEIYGTFSQAFTIITIFMVFASAGIPQAYTRYIPIYIEKGNHSEIPKLIRLGFFSTTVASLGFVFIGYLFAPWIAIILDDLALVSTLRWLLPLLPLLIWIRNMVYVFIAYKELRYSVYIHRFILPTVKLVALYILFVSSYQMEALIFAELIATFVAVIAMHWWYRSRLDIPVKKDRLTVRYAREIFQYSFPLVMSQAVLLALSYADILMLGYYLESDQVGIYKVILNGAYLTTFVYMSLAAVFKPMVSGLLALNQKETVQSLFRILNRWSIFFNGFLILVVLLYGQSAIRLAFTDVYVVGYTAMLILSIGYMGSSSFGHATELLEAMGKTKTIMIVSIGVSLLNVGLNMILIPQYGLNGGAIATAVASIVLSATYAIIIFRQRRIHAFSTRLLPGVAAFIVLAVPLRSLGSVSWDLGWFGFIGVVGLTFFAYCLLLFSFRGVTGDDKILVSDIARGRKKSL